MMAILVGMCIGIGCSRLGSPEFLVLILLNKQMKKFSILVCTLGMAIAIQAQKLPNKQEAGVWVPFAIKIDGISNEWGDTFQAYNKAVDIFYTISNDDKNNELNELFYTKEKLINVTGIEEIHDRLVPIYNTNGIKSASLFDDNMAYTYELALLIAYLNLPDNSGGTFKYNIKINQAPEIQRPAVITSSTPPPPPPIPISTLAATDFSGEYTLAKKP